MKNRIQIQVSKMEPASQITRLIQVQKCKHKGPNRFSSSQYKSTGNLKLDYPLDVINRLTMASCKSCC